MLGRAADTPSFISPNALVIVVSVAVIFLDAASPFKVIYSIYFFLPLDTTGGDVS